MLRLQIFIADVLGDSIAERTRDYPILVPLLIGAIVFLGSLLGWFFIRGFKFLTGYLREQAKKSDDIYNRIKEELPKVSEGLHECRRFTEEFKQHRAEANSTIEKIRDRLAELDKQIAIIKSELENRK